jgi:uncharacterized protein
MPVNPTFPGVYIEEIPSGVHTIVGVATSITAFIGRALRGPTDQEEDKTERALTINSFADFERTYGGLMEGSFLGHAVQAFFLNGGSQAVIVRLYHPDPPPPPNSGSATPKPSKTHFTLPNTPITLEAAYPGSWGKYLRAAFEPGTSDDIAKSMGLTGKADIFSLTIRDVNPGGGRVEQYQNLSVKDSPRRIDKVLLAESKLVRWAGADLSTNPPSLPTQLVDDPVTTAEKKLADALRVVPQVPNDVNNARQDLENAQKALEASNGQALTVNDFIGAGKEDNKEGLFALKNTDLFNILSIPPYLATGDVDDQLVSTAAAYCETRRAMLLVDPLSSWTDKDKVKGDVNQGKLATNSKNAALFFPRLKQPNPLHNNQIEEFVPSGAVAGIFARIDSQRGVWKAPAGLEANLVGVPQLSVNLTNAENGELNPLGINCLRAFPAAGRVVWGARTLQGDDRLASEWKYIPVRRTALYIEESLYRGLQWVVFEPNDEPLWAQIRLNVGAFMQNLFRQGAFQGQSPKDAYLVKCDKETTTQNDINLGIVNIIVGFAPLKPAEFVIVKIQQLAGQIAV